MSDNNKYIYCCIDYESMQTEQLEALLTQELTQDSFDNSQMVEKVTEILIEREPEKYDVDVDKAYTSFLNDYLNTEPLFEDTEEEWGDYQDDKMKPSAVVKRTRHSFRFAKAACIAAITAILILIGSMTAYAFGYDLWGNIATWTSETFRFKSSDGSSQNIGEKEVPEVIQEFKEFAAENGLSSKNIPSWLPEGYSVANIKCYKADDIINLHCSLTNDNSSYIMLQYLIHSTDEYATEYEKDDGCPEIYEHNGIEYGIMTNIDVYYAVWIDDNIECFISGFETHDELIKVIDSI